MAQALTFRRHAFVSSISTGDIESLVTNQYANTSKRAIKLQTDLSEIIEKEIKGFKDSENYAQDVENLENARRILSEIQHRVQELEAGRAKLFKPFETLSTLVRELMHDKGIKVKDVYTFGDVKSAIEAPKLSAGEKQMLSFLCYNAFVTNSVILIDEPEISLHVDWQRVLFSKLLEQGTNNQFIVATHSPFIYSKYPDNEIALDSDKGDSNGNAVGG